MDEDQTIHANPGDGTSSLLNLTGASSSGVSPLEQEVLDEYERLVGNMNQVSEAHFSRHFVILNDRADVSFEKVPCWKRLEGTDGRTSWARRDKLCAGRGENRGWATATTVVEGCLKQPREDCSSRAVSYVVETFCFARFCSG